MTNLQRLATHFQDHHDRSYHGHSRTAGALLLMCCFMQAVLHTQLLGSWRAGTGIASIH